jgi:hypothetical protein
MQYDFSAMGLCWLRMHSVDELVKELIALHDEKRKQHPSKDHLHVAVCVEKLDITCPDEAGACTSATQAGRSSKRSTKVAGESEITADLVAEQLAKALECLELASSRGSV